MYVACRFAAITITVPSTQFVAIKSRMPLIHGVQEETWRYFMQQIDVDIQRMTGVNEHG